MNRLDARRATRNGIVAPSLVSAPELVGLAAELGKALAIQVYEMDKGQGWLDRPVWFPSVEHAARRLREAGVGAHYRKHDPFVRAFKNAYDAEVVAQGRMVF